jgi:hypothetical protein
VGLDRIASFLHNIVEEASFISLCVQLYSANAIVLGDNFSSSKYCLVDMCNFCCLPSFFWLSLQTTLSLIKMPIIFLSLCKSALKNLGIAHSPLFFINMLINFCMETILQHIIHLCACVCAVYTFLVWKK